MNLDEICYGPINDQNRGMLTEQHADWPNFSFFFADIKVLCLCVCARVCVRACACAYVSYYVCMYVYMQVRIYAYMHV